MVLTVAKFRISSASNGKVNFDMDVHRDHTVRNSLIDLYYCIIQANVQNRIACKQSTEAH